MEWVMEWKYLSWDDAKQREGRGFCGGGESGISKGPPRENKSKSRIRTWSHLVCTVGCYGEAMVRLHC